MGKGSWKGWPVVAFLAWASLALGFAAHASRYPWAHTVYTVYALASNNWSLNMSSPYLAEDVTAQPLTVKNGHVKVPDGPGLGINVDESRVRRFLSLAVPGRELMDRLCRRCDPRDGLTLLVTRERDGRPHVVATGS